MPFKDANVAAGLPRNDRFQVGRSDVDTGINLEDGALIPVAGARTSWMYYDCSVGVFLDSGIVVHNRLPQVDNAADTLAVTDYTDPRLDDYAGTGINMKCRDQFTDIVQRMGHARYWFRLWGRAVRIGFRVPIPRLVTIGGVAAIPYDKNPQWAFNSIAPGGNFGGTILWRAQWSLWYTVASPPTGTEPPASDPSAHITGAAAVPTAIKPPFSEPDGNAAARPAARGQHTNRRR